MNSTNRIEMSRDGVNWQPVFVRPAPPTEQDIPQPDQQLLPEGYRWCGVHENGKAVRWVPVLVADGGE